MKTVQEFMNWWIKSGHPIKPPFEKPIHTTDIAYALCLYREGRFQVELYVCKANTESPRHKHPNVESISMYLTGNLSFAKAGEEFTDLSKYQIERADGAHLLLGRFVESNDGKEHALRVGPEGGAFLIFEHWKDRDPSSVTMHWDGELVGNKHATTKGDYVANS